MYSVSCAIYLPYANLLQHARTQKYKGTSVKEYSIVRSARATVAVFIEKRQAIVHGRLATGIVFPLWVPNCHLGERQFGSFFTKIPRSWNQEFPYYKGFRGVGRENSAPLLTQQPPPPYAYDAIASLSLAEYVRSFRLCRCTGCRCRACPSAVMAHHET